MQSTFLPSLTSDTNLKWKKTKQQQKKEILRHSCSMICSRDSMPLMKSIQKEWIKQVLVKTKWRPLCYFDWLPFYILWLCWLSTQRRLQSSFGHSRSESSSYHLVCHVWAFAASLQVKNRVHYFWRVRHRAEKSFCNGLSVPQYNGVWEWLSVGLRVWKKHIYCTWWGTITVQLLKDVVFCVTLCIFFSFFLICQTLSPIATVSVSSLFTSGETARYINNGDRFTTQIAHFQCTHSKTESIIRVSHKLSSCIHDIMLKDWG